jgi:hypothetical protein
MHVQFTYSFQGLNIWLTTKDFLEEPLTLAGLFVHTKCFLKILILSEKTTNDAERLNGQHSSYDVKSLSVLFDHLQLL